MGDWKLPWEGGCRCERTRVRVTEPPLLAMACHCAGCQRMTASAFSLSLAIPTTGFAVTQGETVIGGLRGASRHHFCSHCSSWMFTRAEGLDFFVNVRASVLDDHRWVVPYVETCTSEKYPWASTPAVHSFDGIPPNEAFTPLIAEYMERGARP